MTCTAVVFPFDQFGSAGTGAGAQLLGDAFREIIDDTDEETRPTRADAYRGKLAVREAAFETMEQVRGWRTRGRKLARERLADDEYVIWLAGNHLAVLPAFEELGPDALIVQLDAHLDIHAFHDTTPELSHGNFLRHLAEPRPRIVNVGHRDLLLMPSEVSEVFEAVYSAEQVAMDVGRVAKDLATRARRAKRVWFDLDCDALDPAFLPAVQHPQPFGLAPNDVIRLLNAIGPERLAGVSVSEFDPGRDVGDASLNFLGWLIEWLLLKRFER